MYLTELQILWLKSRGDRTPSDACEHGGNYYIFTYDRRQYQPHRVPTDEEIMKEYKMIIYAGDFKALKAIRQSKKP